MKYILIDGVKFPYKFKVISCGHCGGDIAISPLRLMKLVTGEWYKQGSINFKAKYGIEIEKAVKTKELIEYIKEKKNRKRNRLLNNCPKCGELKKDIFHLCLKCYKEYKLENKFYQELSAIRAEKKRLQEIESAEKRRIYKILMEKRKIAMRKFKKRLYSTNPDRELFSLNQIKHMFNNKYSRETIRQLLLNGCG